MKTAVREMKAGKFSARLTPDMGTRPEPEEKPSQQRGTEDGMVVLSYILAGLLFYGGLGWLGDHLWKTSWLLPLGLILGLACSTYLIIKRYGSGA